MDKHSVIRKRGRPASFDYEAALDHAMLAFWKHGYEGTSMSKLMEVMHMNKTSIYAAYGSKQALFEKAVARYANGPAKFIMESLLEPTAYQVVSELLKKAAKNLTHQAHPDGCLVTQGALSCSEDGEAIKQLLITYRAKIESALAKRLEKAKQEGELAPDANTFALAKLVMTVHQGMTIQAINGATDEELLAVADTVANLFANQPK